MPGFKAISTKPNAQPLLWAGLSGLLLLGVLSTAIAWMDLSYRETRRANQTGQRAVIDPESGQVALSSGVTQETAFDVAEPAPAAAPEPETPVPAAPDSAPEVASPVPVAQAVDEPTDAPASLAPATPTEGLPSLPTKPVETTMPDLPKTGGLVPAPAPEVSETVGEWKLPKRNNETTPAVLYARPFTRTPEQRLLSFVVMDAGVSQASLPLLMHLPKEITVAFSPYAPELTGRMATLRRAGYEAWTMLPAQNARFPQDDPGPLGLVATLPKDELLRRLRSIMADGIGSSGLVLPPDETLSTKNAAFSALMGEVDTRGLYLLSTHPTRTTKNVSGGATLKSPVRRADMVLDPEPDEAAIAKKLASLEETLKTSDSLVVVTSARPQTLLLLQRWLKEHTLEAPVTLAPLSAHWLPKEAPETAPVEASGGHGGGHGSAKKEEKKSSGGHH